MFPNYLDTTTDTNSTESFNSTIGKQFLDNIYEEVTVNSQGIFIQEILMIVLLTLTILLAHEAKKKGIFWLQESTISVILGIIFGVVLMAATQDQIRKNITVDSEFLLTVLLPPILFQAGYTIDVKAFFRNIYTIISLAFLGTLFAAFGGAGVLYVLCSQAYGVTKLEALTFGALTAATDTVAVIATLQQIPVNPDLYNTIFGESALNDAVAVIVFRFTVGFAKPDAYFSPDSLIITGLTAIGVFIGSVVIGIAIGLLLAKITKHCHVHSDLQAELGLTIIFAISSYAIAETLQLSGIVSILFCGMVVNAYVANNWTYETKKATDQFFHSISCLAETSIFVYLGLSCFAFGDNSTKYDAGFIMAALLSMFASRLHVPIICNLANFGRKPERKYKWRDQVFIWYTNMRGGICFILALEVEKNLHYREAFRKMVLGTVLVMVLVSVLILGVGCHSILKWFHLMVDPEKLDMDIEDTEEKMGKWREFNDRYVKPFFYRQPDAVKIGQEEIDFNQFDEKKSPSQLSFDEVAVQRL